MYWYLLCIFYMSGSIWRFFIFFWNIVLIIIHNDLKGEDLLLLVDGVIIMLCMNNVLGLNVLIDDGISKD